MRVAISTDGDFVSAHFGRCPVFTIVDIENGKVTKRQEVLNPGHEPGAIPQFLHQKEIDCIVAGGMGARAESFFQGFGIKTIAGISGTISSVIEKLEKGSLEPGDSFCRPGAGKGYGLDKKICDHPGENKR
ncbi:MAG: NifB/NifX family molybdenum-iron cluster-binding protein [Candidatus Omnitrophica bacterium]|nr:NifB/NifX family molybdenum-iron cluster-binding protein [Candidatus Omnitrophota bacterium]